MSKSRLTALLFASACAILAGCSSEGTKPPVAPQEQPPRRAEGLYVSDSTPTSVTLRWRDLSTDETGFRIERRPAGTGEFAAVDTVGRNIQRFTDATVPGVGPFEYVIRAYRRLPRQDEPLLAAASDTATARAVQNTAPDTPHSPSPGNGATDLDPVVPVTLAWTSGDADGDPVRFEVLFGANLGELRTVSPDQADTTFALPATIPLARNHVYFWRVIATDAKGVKRLSPLFAFGTAVDRVAIDFGRFFMGDEDEFYHPGNPVIVGAYDIDKYEVTNGQYAAMLNQALGQRKIALQGNNVVNAASLIALCQYYPAELDAEIEFLPEDSLFTVRAGRSDFPVIEVSWYGADFYAKFYGRRLPFESEWERAARGESKELGVFVTSAGDSVGVGFPFPWGSELDPRHGNFSASGDPYENQGLVRSAPVGFYDGETRAGYATLSGASPFGVQDLAGNVWEWCDDWFTPAYTNPHRQPLSGQFRVIRGASYRERIESAHTYNRSYLAPETTDRVVGFRTAQRRAG